MKAKLPKILIAASFIALLTSGFIAYIRYKQAEPKRFASSVVDKIISGTSIQLYDSLTDETKAKTPQNDFSLNMLDIKVSSSSTKRYSSTQVIDATTPVKQKVYRVSYVVVDPSLSAYQVDVFAVKEKGAWKIDDLLYTKGEIQ